MPYLVAPVMGTTVSIDVRDDEVPAVALDAAVAVLRELEARFTTYRDDSEIKLIERGELAVADAHPDVREVLHACAVLRAETDGAFDAWRGDALDPSGYVKGWAAERAADVLRGRGATRFAINLGGDVICRGGASPGAPWRVGVRDPSDAATMAFVIGVRDGAVATSGSYERGDHVVDARTGRPANDWRSITVLAPDLATADAVATAALAMGSAGPGMGRAPAELRRGCHRPRRPPLDDGRPRAGAPELKFGEHDQALDATQGQHACMGIERDTFLGFIDDLAADLDDHESSAEERAARHFLSRSHFDRLISATAGEPPAAFRRRILLERAAYRLVIGHDGVLQLAVEAGYSSNEAFTRAFSRAYGVTPSAWREQPGQIQLPAPNDVHFHPPGGLRLPGKAEGTTMNLIVRMVEHHIWLVGEMIDRAARVDDAVLDRPIQISVEGIDRDPTIRRLLSRLVGQMNMWVNVIDGRPYSFDVEKHESIDDMRRRLDRVGPAFQAEVDRVVEGGRLDETFIDAQHEPVETYTYGGLIAHVLTFAAHRRILVLGALESAGVPDLGNGDPRKWVVEAA